MLIYLILNCLLQLAQTGKGNLADTHAAMPSVLTSKPANGSRPRLDCCTLPTTLWASAFLFWSFAKGGTYCFSLTGHGVDFTLLYIYDGGNVTIFGREMLEDSRAAPLNFLLWAVAMAWRKDSMGVMVARLASVFSFQLGAIKP